MAAQQLTPKSLLLLFQPIFPPLSSEPQGGGDRRPLRSILFLVNGRSSIYQPDVGPGGLAGLEPPSQPVEAGLPTLIVAMATQTH